MIKLTRLNGNEFVVNCDLIENVEATPDTIVSLTTNQRYVVRENVDEVIARVASFKQRCHPDARLFLRASDETRHVSSLAAEGRLEGTVPSGALKVPALSDEPNTRSPENSPAMPAAESGVTPEPEV